MLGIRVLLIRHLVHDDKMMLGIDGDLHVVPDARAAPTGRHRTMRVLLDTIDATWSVSETGQTQSPSFVGTAAGVPRKADDAAGASGFRDARALEAMRAHPAADYRGMTYRSIGGFAQLTTVRPEAITSRTLRRWPDEIGRAIEP